MIALVSLGIVLASSLSALALLRLSASLHLRGLNSPREAVQGYTLWLSASLVLAVGSFLLGRGWRMRVGPLESRIPGLLAIVLPVAVVIGIAFLDTGDDLGGAAAFLAGGMLGVFIAPSSELRRHPARGIFAAWGALVLVAGTWSLLFLE